MSMSFTNESTIQRPVYTIADLGIRANPSTQQTIIGPTRSLYSLTVCEKVYLSSSVLSLIVLLGLTIDRLIVLESFDPDFTFAFLLFWTTIFCFVYIIQGILRERAFELIAFVSTVLIVLIYVIFNYCANSSHTTFKKIRLGITCFVGPLLIIPGLYYSRQYFKSKNLIYRTVGANASMQKLCEFVFLASSLFKFDAQLAGSALILWLRKGFSKWSQTDAIVVSFGTFITIVWIILGFLSMRFEDKRMVYVFFVISIFEPSIIIWNLVLYSLGDDSLVLELSVYLAGIIALIVRIVTIVVMFYVLRNFNRGLKEKIYGNKSEIIGTQSESQQNDGQ